MDLTELISPALGLRVVFDPMGTRQQNERRFTHWQDLPGGGRRYWTVVDGRSGWCARYVKEVDAAERTRRFWQEIYNPHGQLIEVHDKYPVDRGHRKK